MKTVNDIIEKLEALAPKAYALSWDNPGLLVGYAKAGVSGIYVALDATEAAIEAARACGANLLLTHHPMIFSPVKQINDGDFIGRRILTLIENHMSYYAMHTNYDVARMAGVAGERLGLLSPEVLELTCPTDIRGNAASLGIGCVGDIQAPVSLQELSNRVKEVYDIPMVKVFGDLKRPITRAALCPGSGKHMTGKALAHQCQVLITGDIDHHEGIDALSQGLCIIDAGHHGIEHIFVDDMTGYLREQFPDIPVFGEENHSPFTVF